MSITLTLKTRFTFIDASRDRKRHVKIEPGTYRMLRVDNPLNRANLPWLVIEGTWTGLAESFIRHREEFTVVETPDAAPGGKRKRGKRDKRQAIPVVREAGAPAAEVIAVGSDAPRVSAPKGEIEVPYVPAPELTRLVAEPKADPVVEAAASIPEPVDLTVPALEPLGESDMSRVSAFLGEMTVLESLAAKVHPTVAAKPDIAANLTAMKDLRETLKSVAPAADKKLREELEKAEKRITAQRARAVARIADGDALTGEERKAAAKKIRMAVSVLKVMQTKAAKIAEALRAIPAKRAETLARIPEAMDLIHRTCRWMRNRQADFLRKHPPSPSAMGDKPEAAAAIQVAEAPAEAPKDESAEAKAPALDPALLEMMRSENLDPSNPEDVELARAIQAA